MASQTSVARFKHSRALQAADVIKKIQIQVHTLVKAGAKLRAQITYIGGSNARISHLLYRGEHLHECRRALHAIRYTISRLILDFGQAGQDASKKPYFLGRRDVEFASPHMRLQALQITLRPQLDLMTTQAALFEAHIEALQD